MYGILLPILAVSQISFAIIIPHIPPKRVIALKDGQCTLRRGYGPRTTYKNSILEVRIWVANNSGV